MYLVGQFWLVRPARLDPHGVTFEVEAIARVMLLARRVDARGVLNFRSDDIRTAAA